MLIEDRLANVLAKYTCPILVSVFCQHVNNVIGEWYHTDKIDKPDLCCTGENA